MNRYSGDVGDVEKGDLKEKSYLLTSFEKCSD